MIVKRRTKDKRESVCVYVCKSANVDFQVRISLKENRVESGSYIVTFIKTYDVWEKNHWYSEIKGKVMCYECVTC